MVEKMTEKELNTELGYQCGSCGKQLTYGNIGNSGFCKDCQKEIDKED